MTNDKYLYTYLLFEKFWNEHKEFLKLQIKYGSLPKAREGGPIYEKRKEYYEWLKNLKCSGFKFLENDKSLSWVNLYISDEKIKEAAWVTFILLINKCDGSDEWGRVAEVFKVIVSLLCGNEKNLPYNAMTYLFMVLSYDISLQAIYNGLSLLSKDKNKPGDKYNISDYTLEGCTKIINNKPRECYKINRKAKNNGEFVKEDLTAGTLYYDLRDNRYNDLHDIKYGYNISNIPNTLVQHRNSTIHGAYSITNDFFEKPDAYKARLAGIIYDYITIVYYLIEFIDKVNEDYKKDSHPYCFGQKEITFNNFVKPASDIITDAVKQLHACENEFQTHMDLNTDNQFEIPKHYSILTSIDEILAKTGIPEDTKTLIPAIISDPNTIESLFDSLKSVQTENKEIIISTFHRFIDEHRAQIDMKLDALNSSISSIQNIQKKQGEDIVEMKSGISSIQETQKKQGEDIVEMKSGISSIQETQKKQGEDIVEVKSGISSIQETQEKQGQDIEVIKGDVQSGFSKLENGQSALEVRQTSIQIAIDNDRSAREADDKRREKLKKRKRRITICVIGVAVVLLSGVFGWFVFRNDFLKKHYAKKADQELILARDCEENKDYENAAIHNKLAFDNTLKAFQIDTTDHNLRRRLIYMYQWGKGTAENHEEALKLAIPIKDDSPKNFGRYIYLRYITDPKDTLNVFSEIKRKEYNDTDSSVQEVLQDSLLRLTKAVIGLSFANNEQDEDEYLSLIKDFDAAGMYEAKWEMTKFMLRQKKLFESGKSVHFMPAKTLNNLRSIAWGLNYGEAWRELGNVFDILEVNDLAAIAYKNAILAGKDELYLNYAFSNYELWQEHNDTIYERAYKEYMQKAAENGDSIARMLIALDNKDDKDIKYRDNALLENKAAPQFSVVIARELLSRNPSPSTMNTILQLLHKNGRKDVSLSYLLAHKAFYEGNRLEYISLMQRAWEDSCFSAYLCLGNYCTNIKEYDNARYYYNKVKEKASNDTIQSLAYDGLLNLALVEGDTISFYQNTPKASLLWKLNVGHYKDNPEYIITECQNLLFSNTNSLNEKGMMAYLIGNAYKLLGNNLLAMDWYELAAHILHQTWVYGPLSALTINTEIMDALNKFKELEGYDLSAKTNWSQEERNMVADIHKEMVPKHIIPDESSNEIHYTVPYAFCKWGEEILKDNELPDKYKKALLVLARKHDSVYESSVVAELSKVGLDTCMSVVDIDLEEVESILNDITSPRLLPDDNPRCIEF